MVYRHNFTIIELLVVVSIIAILFSLLMPAFSESKEKARFARWLQFNKQCSNDPACVINLNFQDDDGGTLKNSAQAYQAEGFNAADYAGIIKGNYEWTRGRWAKNKKAILFDGMSAYVEFPKYKYLDFEATSDFTIMAWVKFNLPNDSSNGIFSQYYTNGDMTGYEVYFVKSAPTGSNKKLATVIAGASQVVFNNSYNNKNSPATIDDSSWFQVTMRNKTVNGTQEVNLFLNGVKLDIKKTTAVAGNINKCTASLVLGGVQKLTNQGVAAQNANYFFKGRMDEFMVYSRALSDREINNHYLMGNVHGN